MSHVLKVGGRSKNQFFSLPNNVLIIGCTMYAYSCLERLRRQPIGLGFKHRKFRNNVTIILDNLLQKTITFLIPRIKSSMPMTFDLATSNRIYKNNYSGLEQRIKKIY